MNQTGNISMPSRLGFENKLNEGSITFKLNPYQQGDKQMREAMYVKSLTVALPVDVYQKIKQITDDEKISMAQWVRRAVNMALEGDAVEEE
jgi:hypothetical protein